MISKYKIAKIKSKLIIFVHTITIGIAIALIAATTVIVAGLICIALYVLIN